MLSLLLAGALAAQPTLIDAGPLKLELHTSYTAVLFHVVDQASQWSPFCHRAYRDGLEPLDAEDVALLAKHAALRKQRGWDGLNPVMYSDGTLEEALAKGVATGVLTPEQADAERHLLAHFRPRIDTLLAAKAPNLDEGVARLVARTKDLKAFAERASRFAMNASARVRFYLLPSPGPGAGGGYNGGVLTVELSKGDDPFGVLVHEAWHALVRTRDDTLNATVKQTPGLDYESLSEGMAYAVWGDNLVAAVRQDLQTKAAFDQPYVRFRRLGLALRPLLKAALDDPNQNLLTFLPQARDVFLAVRELSLGLDAAEKPR